MRRVSLPAKAACRSVFPALFAVVLTLTMLGGFASAGMGQGDRDEQIAAYHTLMATVVRDEAPGTGRQTGRSSPTSGDAELDPAATGPARSGPPRAPGGSARATCAAVVLPAYDPLQRCAPIRAPPRA